MLRRCEVRWCGIWLGMIRCLKCGGVRYGGVRCDSVRCGDVRCGSVRFRCGVFMCVCVFVFLFEYTRKYGRIIFNSH